MIPLSVNERFFMSHPTPSWHDADPNADDFRATLHERYRQLRKVAPVNLTPRGSWRLTTVTAG